MLTRGKILICPACVKIFSNLCKSKRSFKPNVHPYDSEIENRRVRQENIIVIMNISFHHPPIGYFLESHISWSSGKIFPWNWSLVNAQQKKTNKNGQKSEKKGKEKKQKVDIEKAVSLSNKTSWNFSTFPPNFRSCIMAPGTGWSQNYSNSIFTFDSFGLEMTRKQLLLSVLVQTIYYFDQNFQDQMHGLMSRYFFHKALKDYMYSNTSCTLFLWQLCFH